MLKQPLLEHVSGIQPCSPSMECTPDLIEIPRLLKTIMTGKGNISTAAAKRIYELCDVHHKQNRVPMICSGKYDVLTPLVWCLAQESDDKRHLACLALNNLSIPSDNKRVMGAGPCGRKLVGGLCKAMADSKKESYLFCICLVNLSFLEENIATILQYSPEPNGSPLQHSDSLIRILERALKTVSINSKSESPKSESIFTKFFKPKPAIKSEQLKSETIRWTCGLIKNLAKSEENAALFGQTAIPTRVVENLRSTGAPPSRWTSNSVEDFSLFIVLNLAQWPVSRQCLVDAGALDLTKKIIIMRQGLQGLQCLKATMACALLGISWTDVPSGGSAAAQSISELLTNIIEKKGKDGQYAHGVFKLYTATKAYHDLCQAANAADYGSGSNTKVLAVPSAVAACLQVISNLEQIIDNETGALPKHVADDVKCAEYSAAALSYMLPAVLKEGEPLITSKPTQSSEACEEIVSMLNRYANLAQTSAEGKSAALRVAEEMKSDSWYSRPILESSYELWKHYQTREEKPVAIAYAVPVTLYIVNIQI